MNHDTGVPVHLSEWAREPGPSRILADAFARFERGQVIAGGICRVELTERERRQVGRVLPARWVASGRDVGWRDLRAGLAANDTTLESVVANRCGPWRNRVQDRRASKIESGRDHELAVQSLWLLLTARTGTAELPQAVLDVVRRGLFGRRVTTSDVERIQRALDWLPTGGETLGLAVLAARVFGDAHALDRSAALGRAVARFVALEAALRSGQPALAPSTTMTPPAWRAAWAGVGVVCDQVSSLVLVLNLPLTGEAPAVDIAAAAVGEPVWLTLRSMTGGLSVRSEVGAVFVCENPSIVEAAADALGAASRPLICTFGRPNAAALKLLGTIGAHTEIRVQADADVTGRAIVDALLVAQPTATTWRMPETGVVYEEEIVDQLLSDLGP